MEPETNEPQNQNKPAAEQQAAPSAAEQHDNVPPSWPGAFGVYKYSKGTIRLNIGTLVVLYLISFAVAIVLSIFDNDVGLIASLISYIVDALIATAAALVLVAGVRGQKVEVGKAINESVPLFVKMLFLQILIMASYILSLLLFVIPFFFVLPRLALAGYFLVDKKMGVLEAYKASWSTMKGNSLKIWGIIGVNILMALLCVTLIGIPIAIYLLIMYSGASVVLYEMLNRNPATQPAAAAAPPAQTPPPAETPATNPTPPTV